MKQLTAEDIARLKREYPNQKLRTATSTNKQGEKITFVFVPIDRSLMDLAGKQAESSITTAMTMQMVATCVFGDKNLIQNDDSVFRGLSEIWSKIQKVTEFELGEL
jgi:hypothetical protein